VTGNSALFVKGNVNVNGGLNVNGTNKTFVIDNPTNPDKYLVHVCLEGPEAGVYYRGQGEITNNLSTRIRLPHYVEKIASDFIVNVTPIFNKETKKHVLCSVSEVENNEFEVFGENCRFNWLVFGSRGYFNVEPNKNETYVTGEGPYKYLL
jgi:hypothetical protein